MTKTEIAFSMHDRGCNCAQSVVCAFAKECGMDVETLMKVSEGFGLGCGGMAGICGALSGAIMAASCLHADGNNAEPRTKKTTYAVAKQLCADFEKECGALRCCELKGVESGKPLTPCARCIEVGVKLVEDMLGGKYANN